MIECPVCHNDYSRIATHWANGSCSISLTTQQKQVAHGLLLGDGTLSQTGANPRLQVACVEKEYLYELENIFGVLSAGVYEHRTAEEMAEESEYSEDDFSDTYMWQSRRCSAFSDLTVWYSPEKIIPNDFELSQEALTHWYCGDGTLHPQGHIRIAASGFYHIKDRVESLFTDSGLPAPSNWNTSQSSLVKQSASMVFTKSQTEELFSYMRAPVSGFTYKWPDGRTS